MIMHMIMHKIAAFKKIPAPLQKQALIRLGFSVVFLLMLAILLPVTRDIYICLPCAAAAVFLLVSAYMIFRRGLMGDYLVVSGTCQSIELSAVKRRVKSVIIQADGQTVQVMIRGRMRKITPGTPIDLYLTKDTPIYEKGGVQLLYTYLAIDIKGH